MGAGWASKKSLSRHLYREVTQLATLYSSKKAARILGSNLSCSNLHMTTRQAHVSHEREGINNLRNRGGVSASSAVSILAVRCRPFTVKINFFDLKKQRFFQLFQILTGQNCPKMIILAKKSCVEAKNVLKRNCVCHM